MSLEDFFTNSNNPSIPKQEYLFGTRHVILLVSTILISIILSLLFYKKSKKTKQTILYIFTSILLFFEITSRIVNLVILDSYTWQNIIKILLPMHICSVMVWSLIVAVFSKNKTLLNFATIGGLLATVAFLLYPAVGINRKYMSFTCLYSTISHATGFICAICAISYGLTSYKFKDMYKTFICFTIMFLWGALLNFVILPGSDYMYMINDPLELNLNFPYQILYVILISIYITSFYLIYYIKEKIKLNRKKEKDN